MRSTLGSGIPLKWSIGVIMQVFSQYDNCSAKDQGLINLVLITQLWNLDAFALCFSVVIDRSYFCFHPNWVNNCLSIYFYYHKKK